MSGLTPADPAPDSYVQDIGSLLASRTAWNAILGCLTETFEDPLYLEAIAHKDLYVTEVIRASVVPSIVYPQVDVVFKGGTAMAKAHGILRRFSEDVDINIVPPTDGVFGDNRRKKIRRELHGRLDAAIPLALTHQRRGSSFATTTIEFPSLGEADATEVSVTPEVIVEMMIRQQPPGMTTTRTVSSFAGEAAAEVNPSLLDEFPMLRPFEVVTADPLLAVVDKLDALHWRASSEEPTWTRHRARDIYDLAHLLVHESVRPRLSSKLVAELHAMVQASVPEVFAHRAADRPADGFATSPAFDPDHPGSRALRETYPQLRHLVYSSEDWIEFDDALAVIHGAAHLI